MRVVLLFAVACGGGSKPAAEAPAPATPAPADACVTAYAEYEARWKVARSEELAEVGFDPQAIDEVVTGEVALLPTETELVKLRTQYTAVALFLPDAPWPRALDAADHAIEQCGEEAPRPKA